MKKNFELIVPYMKVLILCCFFLPNVIIGQNSIYKFSQEINDNFQKDNAAYKYQLAAWNYSYIGEYSKALEIWDKSGYDTLNLDIEDSLYFCKFKPADAIDYIISRAVNEKIIIINEAHHVPAHRVFTKKLLDGLFKAGFKYFGCETINNNDTDLNSRKYPILKTGTYSVEPQYGNLIRSALEKGYIVFSYEAEYGENGKERELQQALNIKKIIDKDPNAKILIQCGFSHLIETEIEGWEKTMAGRLFELTGINPLTIDQTKLTETSNIYSENPFYKLIKAEKYSIFIDENKNVFNGPKNLNQYDIRVFHPRTKYKNGRPDWLFQNESKTYDVSNQFNLEYPCLVFAYKKNEDIENAVPIDILELKNRDDKKELVLTPGKYAIVIKGIDGKVQLLNIEL